MRTMGSAVNQNITSSPDVELASSACQKQLGQIKIKNVFALVISDAFWM